LIAKKKTKTAVESPTGLVWDPVNYSCAYYAVLTCMYTIWEAYGPKWSNRLSTINEYNVLLARGFESAARKTRSLKSARDDVRSLLASKYPEYFPTGPRLTSLDRLIEAMFGQTYWGFEVEKCTRCDLVRRADAGAQCVTTVTVDNVLRRRYKTSYSLSHWIAANRIRAGVGGCMCPLTFNLYAVQIRLIWLIHDI
jgi:hypothetical protein